MKAQPPDRIRSLPIWVVWKRENDTKVPYNARTSKKAKSNDPSTWSTYDQARIAAADPRHGYAGVGSMFPEDGGLTGTDFDDCLTEDGDLIPEVAEEIARLNSYSEVSPSGNGVKVWSEATSPINIGKTAFADGASIEQYSRVRFFTFTGDHLPGTPLEIRPAQEAVTHLAERMRPQQEPPRRAMIPAVSLNAGHVRRYCLAALAGECSKMEAAGDGQRHWQRWCSAKALAGFVHTRGITEDEIFDGLDINHGKNQHVARQTIRAAIAAGIDLPRDIPEPKQPTFDADGHACCPIHNERLIECKNGHGWRCPSPKLGETLCFWWQGDGYTPPAELSAADLADIDSLDPAELRRRYLIVIAERDRWKERAVQLELALGQVQTQNRFVTQASGAEKIGAPSMRLTFVELKKELDRVPLEDRQPDQWVQVRPAYMAKCTGQDRSTISRHLDTMKKAGLIEKKVERTFDPETKSWCSELLVRPLVDLSDPAQVAIPSTHGGKREHCPHCHSENVAWMRVKVCRDCEKTIGDVQYQAINPPDVHDAIQEETLGDEAIAFFEEQPEAIATGPTSLMCSVQHKEKTDDLSSDVQIAIQARPPSPQPSVPLIDLDKAPGVLAGKIAPDDPWLALQRQMQAQAVTS